MMERFWSDYRSNVRDFRLEEPMDFALFRPLAYIIVKLTWPLPLHPNHFSFLALLVAVSSSYAMSLGTADGFTYGGMGILIFSVLDCCDGMIARMKGKSSTYGELIDMFVDLVSNIAFYTGLFFGLKRSQDFGQFAYISWFAGIAILLHASFYHFYKEQFFLYLNNNPHGRYRKVEKLKRDLQNLNKQSGHYFEKLLLRLFLIFSSAQKPTTKSKFYNRQRYSLENKNILPLWALIAGSSHLFIFGVSLIFHRIGIYFYFSLFFSNLWLILVFIIQTSINASLEEAI